MTRAETSTSHAVAAVPSFAARKAEPMISSFEKNPASGKIPARARDPMMNVLYVCGMNFRRPPMSLMLFECTAWMIEPAPRNRRALKNAWVKRWKTPAVYAPTPSAAIM